MAKWFYVVDGQEAGPIESAALKQIALSGRLKLDDKVRREDLAKWYLAKQVKGLFASDDSQVASSARRSINATTEAAQTNRVELQSHPMTANILPSRSSIASPSVPLTRIINSESDPRSASDSTYSNAGTNRTVRVMATYSAIAACVVLAATAATVVLFKGVRGSVSAGSETTSAAESKGWTGNYPPWMYSFVKSSSSHYHENGYGDLKFGDSSEEVTRKGAPSDECFLLSPPASLQYRPVADEFFFEGEKLRVIQKVYVTDLGAHVDELVRLFGKALPNDVFKVAGQSVWGDPNSATDAYYFFPNSISCLSVFSDVARNSMMDGSSRLRADEKISLSVIDRQWLVPLVYSYGDKLANVLTWIRTRAQLQQLKSVATVPDFPNAIRRVMAVGVQKLPEGPERLNGDDSEVVWFSDVSDDDKNDISGFLSLERYVRDSETPSSSGAELGRVRIVIHPMKILGRPNIAWYGPLMHLYCRMFATLTQKYFPPFGEVYEDHDETGIEFYRWRSDQAVSVEVHPIFISLSR